MSSACYVSDRKLKARDKHVTDWKLYVSEWQTCDQPKNPSD